MLGMTYTWAPKPKDPTATDMTFGGDPVEDDDPLPELPVGSRVRLDSKSYTPPTDFDPEASKPFGNLLDEPLG